MTITAPQNVNKIPLAPGLPVLGSALPLAQNVAHFLTKQYRQLGPVFRVRALNREMVVLAGVEANLFFIISVLFYAFRIKLDFTYGL